MGGYGQDEYDYCSQCGQDFKVPIKKTRKQYKIEALTRKLVEEVRLREVSKKKTESILVELAGII